jgi:hypothetical protein
MYVSPFPHLSLSDSHQPSPPPFPHTPHPPVLRFNIYLLDYCKKRGYHKTATQLVIEAHMPPGTKPPIDTRHGLFFELASSLLLLLLLSRFSFPFNSLLTGGGPSSGSTSKPVTLAMVLKTQSSTARFARLALFSPDLYSPVVTQQYQKRKRQALQTGGISPSVNPQPLIRYPLPNGVPGLTPSPPAGQMNGIGPGGQPTYYGLANPPSQPNDRPGPPGPLIAPGQPFPPDMDIHPSMNHEQRHPNGAPQYYSPTMAPSPQSQGGPQEPSASLGPLGPSPHMNWAAFSPPNRPQHPQGPDLVGSAHPIPAPTYQQLVRPHGSHDTSSQNHMNPHPSPTMSGLLSTDHERSHMYDPHGSSDAELVSYPADIVGEAILPAGFGDWEAHSLTAKNKVCNHPLWPAIFLTSRRLTCSKPSGSMPCGSSEADHLITALGHPLEPPCTGHCKFGDV